MLLSQLNLKRSWATDNSTSAFCHANKRPIETCFVMFPNLTGSLVILQSLVFVSHNACHS